MRFVLRSDRAAKYDTSTIYAQYVYQTKPYRFPTPYRISADQWDATRQVVTGRSAEAKQVNDGLKVYRAKFDGIIAAALKADKEPTPQHIKAELAGRVEHAPKDTSISDAIRDFQETRREEMKSSPGTLENYRKSLAYLTEWMQGRRQAVTWEGLTEQAVETFVGSLRRKGLADSTIGRVVKDMKACARWAHRNGYHTTTHYTLWHRPRPKAGHKAYLYADELERFERAELPPKLAEARDMFLLLAETGQRHSDLFQIRAAQIKPATADTPAVIHLTTTKTRTAILVPLSPRAMRILSGRPDGFTKRTLNSLNDLIAKAAEGAALERLVTVTRYEFGKRVDMDLPLHKCITTHTARRTFITNAILRGVPPTQIMKITGHSSKETLYAYEQATAIEAVQTFAKLWGEDQSPER